MEKYSAWSSEILNILRSHNHYIEGNWNQMYLHDNPTLRVHWRIIACMLNECKLAASGSSLLTSSLQPPVHGGIAISKRSLHLAHRAINNLSKSDHMQHNWAPCITHGEKKKNGRNGWTGTTTDRNRKDNRRMTSDRAGPLHRWQSQPCRVQNNQMSTVWIYFIVWHITFNTSAPTTFCNQIKNDLTCRKHA